MSGGCFRLYNRTCPHCKFNQDVWGELLCDESKDYLSWRCKECSKSFIIKIIIVDKIKGE